MGTVSRTEKAGLMMWINKMLTREAAIERYGAIDYASMHWPEADRWIKLFAVPPGVFHNWKVMNTQVPVSHIACNLDMHRPLQQALDMIVRRELTNELHTFDGAFNVRMVRGSTVLTSAHSYGLAIDINAAENPLGAQPVMSQEFVSCFTTQGFDWGGQFHRVDGMHLSFCWEGPRPA